ncbi:hypothetical protein M9979_16620 [Sphingomonas sp. RP10(2022)]|uniref:Uncharacterized protein n=1 Tax=Sphingomonas liriopis TaxID=2949094 RepID=A0A9X2HSP4_9SPHN|nr:hypothetical protein [Sphingomonas liriopis]MCP3736493.1 hypothetical protein [Sphingomonas liriopis]
MVDKSWGSAPSPGFRIRTNASPDQRAAERAEAREARAAERLAANEQRVQDRAVAREAEAQARERARTERRETEQQAASGDPHAAAAQRRRSSGRKDVVREQRDTRGYATVVDAGRMRELAKRGASIAGLAGAFGITEAEVAQILAAE